MNTGGLSLPEGSFAAFIYDCDGTLVDTMPLHYEAWVYALRENGATYPFSDDDFHEYAGMKEQDTVILLNEKFGVNLDPEKVYETKERYFLKRLDAVIPIRVVTEHARFWKDRVPVAVASGSPRPSVLTYLRKAGMEGWFPLIITPEDVEHGKPAPDMFLLAAARMGVDPKNCLIFEDGQGGFRAATAAGMPYVVVPRRAVHWPAPDYAELTRQSRAD